MIIVWVLKVIYIELLITHTILWTPTRELIHSILNDCGGKSEVSFLRCPKEAIQNTISLDTSRDLFLNVNMLITRLSYTTCSRPKLTYTSATASAWTERQAVLVLAPTWTTINIGIYHYSPLFLLFTIARHVQTSYVNMKKFRVDLIIT